MICLFIHPLLLFIYRVPKKITVKTVAARANKIKNMAKSAAAVDGPGPMVLYQESPGAPNVASANCGGPFSAMNIDCSLVTVPLVVGGVGGQPSYSADK